MRTTGSPLNMILDRWNALSRSRQLALAGIVAGTIVVLYFVFISSSSPNLVVAYDGLALEDSSAIADELEKEGVSYEVRGGGSQIAVPANRVAEVRMKIAAAGLGATGGTVGFEIFDKTNFGATDKDKDINYVRALQGELVRSINTVDGIRSSRVLLSMPAEALFSEDQEQPKASVVLSLKPGVELEREQVHAITNLVTSSVKGLKNGGVTIMDDKANVLYDGAANDGAFGGGATTTQLDLQHQYENSLQSSLRGLLTNIVGPSRSSATVRAELNFDQITEQQKTITGAPVAISSTTTTETYTGANQNAGAVPGTGSNGGASTTGTNATGNSDYSNTQTTVNNEVPTTVTERVQAPGKLERLSVSVVLDDSVTADQETAIRSAVAAAVGLDQTRGDLLNVVRLPFDASVADALTVPAGDPMQQYLQYVKLLFPLLAVVLGFVLVLLLLRNLSKRQLALPQPYMATAIGPSGMALSLEAPMPTIEPLPLAASTDPAEDRVFKLAEGNPKSVADVVQTWMREDDR